MTPTSYSRAVAANYDISKFEIDVQLLAYSFHGSLWFFRKYMQAHPINSDRETSTVRERHSVHCSNSFKEREMGEESRMGTKRSVQSVRGRHVHYNEAELAERLGREMVRVLNLLPLKTMAITSGWKPLEVSFRYESALTGTGCFRGR